MMGHVLTRMRVVRQIAEKIIAFLSQIEDFQRRLFEEKKFVVQTDYCITLDRVPEEFYAEILANEAQLEAWRRIYNIGAWSQDLCWQGTFDEAFLRNHPYVMLDMAFFDHDFIEGIINCIVRPRCWRCHAFMIVTIKIKRQWG
jgi:adenine-specific DNA-methyltransferase